MKIIFSKTAIPKSGNLIVFSDVCGGLSPFAQKVNREIGGQLSRSIEANPCKKKFGQIIIFEVPVGLQVTRITLVGLGDLKELDFTRAQKLGGKIIEAIKLLGDESISVAFDYSIKNGFSAVELSSNIAFGARLRYHRFDKYRTKKLEDEIPTINRMNIMTVDAKVARRAFMPLKYLAEGVLLARDLVTEPGNVLYPESYAAQITSLSEYGVDVEILGEKDMQLLGMKSLLAVGQGSDRKSQMVIMRWQGGPSNQKPIAFVGKGVTFDSGGISLKPVEGMADMKFDMAGSAAVVGLLKTLACRKADVNVVGVVALVENMPSSKALRPGDVIKSLSGQTIEIINTDCEGRLVLADALWYTQERFKPQCMINLATLTYTVIATFGYKFAGIFSNSDELAGKLTQAGLKADEAVWRLPLSHDFDKLLDSDIADMKNCTGRPANMITAAQFLQRFVNETPWVHIDIAGTAWRKEADDLAAKGATGYGVRLLNQFVSDNYE